MIITAFVMIATSGVMFAQATKPGNGAPGTNKDMPGFVDANKNGVCDTFESNAGTCVRKGQGQAPSPNCGKGMGNGQCRSNMQGQRAGNGRRAQ